VGRVGLDAKQGVIRALAPITGIVADGRILLTSKHRDHTAVEIQDQTRSVVWEMNEILQQSVIHAVHLLPERVRSSEEEATQGLWVGETRQARQILEGTVGTQERRGLDAVQAQHDRVDQSEDHLREAVASVAPGIGQVLSQEMP